MRVRDFHAADAAAWDEFVLRHPHGSPFHLTAWKKSMEETYGYRAHYLAVEDEAGLRGVLPLFFVESFIVGKALISSPFAVYGGVLADSPEAAAALKARVTALADELDCDYVELRNAYPEQCLGFTRDGSHVTYTRRFDERETEDEIFRSLPHKTRNIVRKALRAGFVARRETQDFAAFDRLYAENLQRLGTPAFPAKHFERLIANFGRGVDIREVRLGGKLVACVMSFHFRDRVMPYYGAADFTHKGLAPTTFMYFDQLRWAAQSGLKVFDFGRSTKDSGTANFKSHWGMEEKVLPYEMLLRKRKDVPHHKPNDIHQKVVVKIWRRLPMTVIRFLGPKMIRLVP